MPLDHWCWHAGDLSRTFIGIEFANPKLGYEITDLQVKTLAWWWKYVAKPACPRLRDYFVGHWETEQGQAIGKTDPYNTAQDMNRLRERLLLALRTI